MANYEALDALFSEADSMAAEMDALKVTLAPDVREYSEWQVSEWLQKKQQKAADKAGLTALQREVEFKQAG